jgi:hypothetical protein
LPGGKPRLKLHAMRDAWVSLKTAAKLHLFPLRTPQARGNVIASAAKQSRVASPMLLMDRRGGEGRLAMTLRNYSTGFGIIRSFPRLSLQ